LRLMISGPSPTTGLISIPGLPFNQSFSVTPGVVKTVTIPIAALLTDYDIVQTKGIHITTDHPVSVYGLNFEPQASEAFMAYPTPLLGTSYCVMARPGNLPEFPYLRSQFAVLAAQNQTTVTITPSPTANLEGHPGTTPFTVLLQQGQTYQLQGSGTLDDVTGTLLTSVKSIAVFGGARCARVPDPTNAAGNQLVEEQLPLNLWGNQAVGFPLASRSNGDSYRVLAASDNTQVRINGTLVATLQQGHFFDTILGVPAVFEGSNPIQVAQFSNGATWDNSTGDPFEFLLPPTGKYLQAYTVPTPDGFNSFFNLFVDQSALNTTFVDGQQVPPASFQQIGASSYFGTQWSVSEGSHVISSSKPVGIQVYGFGFYDGYGYIGGLSR